MIKKFYLLLFLLQPLFVHSASVTVLQPLNFGTIIGHPSGEQIQINASSGPAVPIPISGRNSIVTGGSSARLWFIPDQAGQNVQIFYPVSVNLTGGGHSIPITQFSSNSTTTFTTTSTSPVDFYMGGILHILNGQAGESYTGNITLNIFINNP